MKRWHIISVVLCSYVFFMLAHIPASRVLNYLQQKGSLPFMVNGVSGSIWRGHADSVNLPGKPKLENVDWSVNPLALLLASASADINAEIHKQPLKAHISRQLISGNTSISDAEAKLPAKVVQELLDIPFGELGGDIEMYLDDVQLQTDVMPTIEARIFWQHAQFALDQTIALGQVEININTDDTQQTLVEIKNADGDVRITGNAQIGTDRSYVLNLDLKPKDATGNVAQSLNMFAQRQADGSFRVKQSGNLSQLGF